ncbi:MAG: hypothetical protein CSA58_03855 [Micrococcales bacterium]|nr:MAG: hypothetical protein CSB46_02105 [Micrococcales bacterium]PIE27516.1 MAG: hypothetical protein CSA58_03855 [Micrococcales bacterium]
MPEWWADAPFLVAWLVLYLIGTARGQGTYWLARWATHQALDRTATSTGRRAKVHEWLDGPMIRNGRHALERWGVPAIPLCYLTVGFQTTVLASCGVLRLSWLRFSLAQIPGAAAWALIYATIGFAAWQAALGTAAGSPAGIAVLIVLALLAVVAMLRYRSAQRRLSS